MERISSESHRYTAKKQVFLPGLLEIKMIPKGSRLHHLKRQSLSAENCLEGGVELEITVPHHCKRTLEASGKHYGGSNGPHPVGQSSPRHDYDFLIDVRFHVEPDFSEGLFTIKTKGGRINFDSPPKSINFAEKRALDTKNNYHIMATFKYSILSKYLIAAFAVLGVCLEAAAAEKALPQMHVTYGELDETKQQYTPGTLELIDTDGTTWSVPNAQFRLRGATALNYSMKPSLNVKLKDAKGEELDLSLLDLRKASSFILDAMAIDRINMRNRVAFDIWNSFSRLPYATDFDSRNGTVGAFVEMYINGKYKGIYCLSDKINRKLLDLKKPQVDEDTGDVAIRGVLYKHGTTDQDCDQAVAGFYNGYIDWVARPNDAWELHEPEEYAGEAAWAPMTLLYADDNFNDYNYVKVHFWLENLADYIIHVMALGIEDNWGNKNKYFSIRNLKKAGEDDGRFVVTPWDLDASLGGSYDGRNFDGNYSDWAPADMIKNAPLPFAACLDKKEFADLLRRRWIEGSMGAFAVDSVARRLADVCELFVESGAWQRTVNYWHTQKYSEEYVEDLEKEMGLVIEWYADRFRVVDEYFGVTDDDRAEAGMGSPTVPAAEEDGRIFNLQGIPVGTMTAPGIYIVDGHKVLVR